VTQQVASRRISEACDAIEERWSSHTHHSFYLHQYPNIVPLQAIVGQAAAQASAQQQPTPAEQPPAAAAPGPQAAAPATGGIASFNPMAWFQQQAAPATAPQQQQQQQSNAANQANV